MSQTGGTGAGVARVIPALGLALSMLGLSLAMAGCIGFVRGPGGVVVPVPVLEPDIFLWGGYGGGYRGDYGRRGFESRGGR